MKKVVITLLLLVFISAIALAWLTFSATGKRSGAMYHHSMRTEDHRSSDLLSKLSGKARISATFARSHGFNTSICFLVDMSLPSGRNRFFIFDMEHDSVLESALVTHGRCNEDWLEGKRFDNGIGSGCTSLGKYKIGAPYFGRFGRAFKLYGLEATNSNAYKRFVVLHSHKCVPEYETGNEICQSDGCPTVSPRFLNQLAIKINASKKPVLLWIYN